MILRWVKKGTLFIIESKQKYISLQKLDNFGSFITAREI